MTGTATVALTELIPARADRRALLVATAANMGGLGLGPLIAGLLANTPPISPPWCSRRTWQCWPPRAWPCC
jgi:MFS family permease